MKFVIISCKPYIAVLLHLFNIVKIGLVHIVQFFFKLCILCICDLLHYISIVQSSFMVENLSLVAPMILRL